MKQIWAEKYRPSSINDYVFCDTRQEQQIKSWINDGTIPHLLLHGSAGTGKTTLAKVLIDELGVLESDVKYINASTDNGVDYIRDTITNFASTMSFGDFKVILLDEADYLSPNAQAALRGVLEQYINVVRFVLTCNYPHKLMPALHSRCTSMQISKLDRTEFTARVATILVTEGIKVDLDILDTYVSASYPDMRKCINLIQNNSQSGELLGVNKDEVGDEDYRIEAISLFKLEKFQEARKVICSRIQLEEYDDFYRFMYDNLDFWADTPQKEEDAILAIRNGMCKHPLAGDPEINLSATLVELEIITRG